MHAAGPFLLTLVCLAGASLVASATQVPDLPAPETTDFAPRAEPAAAERSDDVKIDAPPLLVEGEASLVERGASAPPVLDETTPDVAFLAPRGMEAVPPTPELLPAVSSPLEDADDLEVFRDEGHDLRRMLDTRAADGPPRG